MPLATQPCLLRPCATRSRHTCAVRIAFSGAHRVGKTTLIERVAEALPGYALVPEPYHLLQEDGYDFADPPSAEDFEAQLERSIVELEEAGECALLDRCPADLLAYLRVGDHDVNAQLERCREAIGLLDLVVLVPIEEPTESLCPHTRILNTGARSTRYCLNSCSTKGSRRRSFPCTAT